jgi:DNA-binding MarR family transcriptional regulator
MKPTNNIGYLLHHLSFVLDRQSDQVLQEQLGIGFSQFKILMCSRWNPSVQQRQIALNLGQTEASVSRQIKLLKDRGLLTMQRNPKNKREHITTLTTRGERLTEAAREALNKYHAPIFASLNEKRREDILNELTIMHDTACSPHPPGMLN